MKVKIGLAAPRIAASIAEGVVTVKNFLAQAAAQKVEIICFPETYIPGLRGQDFEVSPHDQKALEAALEEIRQAAKEFSITTIIGMEWMTETGLQNGAFVISREGEILGFQTKNQLDPSEDNYYVPGEKRQLFEANGVKFGITICHEGWRYPESVRWAATRGSQIVFHPQLTGSDQSGVTLEKWGDPSAPYYEKAMMCRALENTIFFASVNNALRFQDSATSIIAPSGKCLAYLPYGGEGLLVEELDLAEATGLLAARYSPKLYD